MVLLDCVPLLFIDVDDVCVLVDVEAEVVELVVCSAASVLNVPKHMNDATSSPRFIRSISCRARSFGILGGCFAFCSAAFCWRRCC